MPGINVYMIGKSGTPVGFHLMEAVMWLSSDFKGKDIRNQVSIMLAQLRPQLSARQYRRLLRLQWAADAWTRGRVYSPEFRRIWHQEMEAQIVTLEGEVVSGKVSGEGLAGLEHLLSHLLV